MNGIDDGVGGCRRYSRGFAMPSFLTQTRRLSVVLLIGLAADLPFGWGQTSTNPSAPTPVAQSASGTPQMPASEQTQTGQRSEKAISPQQLATGSYADRQRATLEMWRQRELSRQAVQNAARNQDPEVAERAEWILRQWRSGILPGVNELESQPKTSGTSLSRNAALGAVLEQGAFEAVLIAVEESAGTIEFEQIQRQVARMLTERFPIYVDRAAELDRLEALLQLLDTVAINKEIACTIWDLKHHLGMAIDVDSCLPKAARTWSQTDQLICRSLFASLHGDPSLAIKLAEQAGDADMIRMTKVIAGDWEAILAAEQSKLNAVADQPERVEAYAWLFAAAHRTGATDIEQDAKKFLLSNPGNEASTLNELRWRILALHDNVDDAIEVAARADKASAAKIAVAASRHDRAIAHCGYDPQLISGELEQWIDIALAEQRELSNRGVGELAPSIEQLYAFCRLLIRIDDKDSAFRIYERLISRDFMVTPWGHSLLDLTLTELTWVRQMDWVAKIAVTENDNSTNPRTREVIAKAAGTDRETFDFVLAMMQQMFPRITYFQRFNATFDLFRGRTPTFTGRFAVEFDKQAFFDKMFLMLSNAEMGESQSDWRSRSQTNTSKLSAELFSSVLELFQLHGRLDLMRQGDQLLAMQGDTDAMIRLAENAYEQGELKASLALWDEVVNDSGALTATTNVITLDHSVGFAKALVGKWLIAKRSGYQELAKEYETRIALIAMSPSLKLRHELSDYVREHDQEVLAISILRNLVIQNSYAGPDAPDQFGVSVSYVSAISNLHEDAPETFSQLNVALDEVVKWSDIAVLGILNDPYLERTYIAMPLSVRTTKLQHAIDTDDSALAKKSIAQIEHYDRLNIDFGERLLPKVKEAGMDSIAAEAMDRLMDRGLKHVERYPFDATSLNNFAWTAAVNNQRIDDARRLSRQAVFLEPDSVVFRDTLAEVMHRIGDNQQALAIESACLLDTPDDWHLHTQIKKYRELVKASQSKSD
ncbi:hypothetical protein ACMFWY_10455 [Roseiconus sp. JC912]